MKRFLEFIYAWVGRSANAILGAMFLVLSILFITICGVAFGVFIEYMQ